MSIIQQIFAYNTGAPISGTTQVGDIAIIENEANYYPGLGGLTWWGGPDESEGYVIVYPVPVGDHPTPISGVTAYLGFKGTKNMTNPFNESTFVELTNISFNQSFTAASDASIWLTTNGYWNSYPCLGIATNAGGGLDGFNVGGQAVAFTILSNPAVGTTYPVGSFITFQNGEVRTLTGIDDYGAQYDVFYDSPISTSILFPITICS